MNAQSYLLLGLVIVWALGAVIHILRHGSCGCGSKSGCSGCSGGCKGCHKCK